MTLQKTSASLRPTIVLKPLCSENDDIPEEKYILKLSKYINCLFIYSLWIKVTTT